MKEPLVSIIIPTFNRAGLLGETLDSIIAQTYTHWECIVVDDTSTDDTAQVMRRYVAQDVRIHYYDRPESKPKGANACRNFGFEKSTGAFVIWFDSDDLMLPGKIEKQLNVLLQNEAMAFSVARFKNMQADGMTEEPAFDANLRHDLNQCNYVSGRVFWGTIDFLGKRGLFDNRFFNESLRSGQEFHFFSAVLTGNPQGLFLNESLSLRRIHEASIQQGQKADPLRRLQNKFAVYWSTLNDHRALLETEARIFLMRQSAIYYHKLLFEGVTFVPLSVFLNGLRPDLGKFKTVVIYLLMQATRTTRKGDLLGSAVIKKIIG
ncbi:glycosyltransferase family 2 protein [Flavobacterium caeni]|uniref:Glycosyltransferase involved in cell wall bisynthesis n=1 Tax=Flavobacterium caeni TaxID=490189 RepID=A0A1G5FKT9_9FLAO|nr:glycosyltransferase family 2 protein [Flavobacterium caeni]SCY39764.1 Glycosyltransferase involved in cell wall bisynthesis [Flavobacterium caeni]